jgi:predicted ribosome-associated RNA-binding protein Tma20
MTFKLCIYLLMPAFINTVYKYRQQAATQERSQAVFNVTVHPKLPDTVVIGSLDETDLRPQEREIIVDATCGAAVLRGAHVFAPGIMGMPTGAIYFFLSLM